MLWLGYVYAYPIKHAMVNKVFASIGRFDRFADWDGIYTREGERN